MENQEKFRVIINAIVDGRKINETFNCSDKIGAITFASGYAEALYWFMELNHPLVPQLDGYTWWNSDNEDVIIVVDEEGNIVK